MSASKPELWQRFQKYYVEFPLGLAMDISRMNFPDDFMANMKKPIKKPFIAMAEIFGDAGDMVAMIGFDFRLLPEPNSYL